MMTLSMTAMMFEQGDCASPDWRSCQEWCLAGVRINAIDVRVVLKLFQNCHAGSSIDALDVRAYCYFYCQ